MVEQRTFLALLRDMHLIPPEGQDATVNYESRCITLSLTLLVSQVRAKVEMKGD